MQLTKIYYDEGISGTQIRNRIGFQQMIEDALQGRFNLILTKEVSRFARNTVDTLAYTRKLKEAGVGIIFTIDHIDTRDQDGELRLTIMASLAQEESRKTSERVKWGQKRRMEQGVVFGRDMLGYTVKNGILSIQEEEALIVKSIFHKYTNEGKGICDCENYTKKVFSQNVWKSGRVLSFCGFYIMKKYVEICVRKRHLLRII